MIGKDRSGQVMLISSFMLAIVVVAITLMLNNVIYSSNMAYVGYMDQSRYDDLSYKQATTDEAAFAYSNDSAHYDDHMSDYAKCLNNLTSAKGGFIELTSTSYSTPPSSPLPITDTYSTLSIFSKDSNRSYTIYTGSSNTGTPTPSPSPSASPSPIPYKLFLSADRNSFSYGSDGITNLSVKVTDVNGIIQTGVPVFFSLSNTTMGGVVMKNGDPIDPIHGVPTDGTGYAYARFADGYYAGTEYITAYTGTYNSNVLAITVTRPLCPHSMPVPTNTTTQIGSGNGALYTVKIQFDFTGFTNGNVKILSYSDTHDKMDLYSSPLYHSAGNYIDFTYQATSGSGKGTYTMVLTLEVTATCNIDGLLYDKTFTYTVTGKEA